MPALAFYLSIAGTICFDSFFLYAGQRESLPGVKSREIGRMQNSRKNFFTRCPATF
jgi:hypothetical protein